MSYSSQRKWHKQESFNNIIPQSTSIIFPRLKRQTISSFIKQYIKQFGFNFSICFQRGLFHTYSAITQANPQLWEKQRMMAHRSYLIDSFLSIRLLSSILLALRIPNPLEYMHLCVYILYNKMVCIHIYIYIICVYY